MCPTNNSTDARRFAHPSRHLSTRVHLSRGDRRGVRIFKRGTNGRPREISTGSTDVRSTHGVGTILTFRADGRPPRLRRCSAPQSLPARNSSAATKQPSMRKPRRSGFSSSPAIPSKRISAVSSLRCGWKIGRWSRRDEPRSSSDRTGRSRRLLRRGRSVLMRAEMFGLADAPEDRSATTRSFRRPATS